MTESSLRRCPACGSYSMRAACPACGAATRTPHPARYRAGDRWGKYRRQLMAESAAKDLAT